MVSLSSFEYQQLISRASRGRQSTPKDGCTDESKLHEAILTECGRRGWIAFHSRMDVPSTLTKGAPDFFILADGGAVILVECKTKTGKLTLEQSAMIAWGKKLDHTIHVVRSIEEFHKLIQPETK